jgi:hypothetical protein
VGEVDVSLDTLFAPYVISRGPAGEVRVFCQEYKNRPYISIRSFFESDSGEMLPTKRGITLPLGFLPDIVEGLKDQADRVIKKGLLEREEIEERAEERLKVKAEGVENEPQGKKVEPDERSKR